MTWLDPLYELGQWFIIGYLIFGNARIANKRYDVIGQCLKNAEDRLRRLEYHATYPNR